MRFSLRRTADAAATAGEGLTTNGTRRAEIGRDRARKRALNEHGECENMPKEEPSRDGGQAEPVGPSVRLYMDGGWKQIIKDHLYILDE